MNLIEKLAPRRTAADLAAARDSIAVEIAAARSRIPTLEADLDAAVLAGRGELEALDAVSAAKLSIVQLETRHASLVRAHAVAIEHEAAATLVADHARAVALSAEIAKAANKTDRTFAALAADLATMEVKAEDLRTLNEGIEAAGGQRVPEVPVRAMVRGVTLPALEGGYYWRGAAEGARLAASTAAMADTVRNVAAEGAARFGRLRDTAVAMLAEAHRK